MYYVFRQSSLMQTPAALNAITILKNSSMTIIILVWVFIGRWRVLTIGASVNILVHLAVIGDKQLDNLCQSTDPLLEALTNLLSCKVVLKFFTQCNPSLSRVASYSTSYLNRWLGILICLDWFILQVVN